MISELKSNSVKINQTVVNTNIVKTNVLKLTTEERSDTKNHSKMIPKSLPYFALKNLKVYLNIDRHFQFKSNGHQMH